MKILYITQFFYPETAAAASRAYDNASIWQRLGHKVTVFTGFPNFPSGKLFLGWKMKLLYEDYIQNIRVLRSRIIIRPNKGKLSRAILYSSFAFFGMLNMLINRKKITGPNEYDIVLATSGTIFAPILGCYFAKMHKIPFVLELRDITFDQMLAVGRGNKGIGYHVIKKLELFFCSKANRVVTVTDGFKSRLVESGIDESKIDVIYNGALVEGAHKIDDNKVNAEVNKMSNPKYITNANTNTSASANTSADDIFMSYFGTFGVSQDLTRVIKIITSLSLSDKTIRLLLIGEGAEKDKIKDYLVNNNLTERVIVCDGVSKNSLLQYYDISDFCIVTLRNNEHFKSTVPSKLFSIMANKKPVIYIGPEGECASIIKNANAGIAIIERDVDKIIDSLNEFLHNINKNGIFNGKLREYGLNGFNYVNQNFNREKLAGKYVDVLSEVKNNVQRESEFS